MYKNERAKRPRNAIEANRVVTHLSVIKGPWPSFGVSNVRIITKIHFLTKTFFESRFLDQYLGAEFRVCGSGDPGPHGCAAKARHPGECARPMVKPCC